MLKQMVGGILLVAGTSIGAGMLALPVVTGEGGFFPAFFMYLLCWFFMTATGLIFLEICLGMPPGANLISMAESYLGRWGKACAWALYLFLFYCLSIAYLSGGGGLLAGWLDNRIPHEGGVVFFLLLLSPFVYAGAKAVDRLNALFMTGLILSYAAFVGLSLPHVQLAPLTHSDWSKSFAALPVIFTSFSYQGIIPTLVSYFKRDAKKIRIAIMGGTSVAFFIYLLWEFLILGIVPRESLEEANLLGLTAVHPLKDRIVSQSTIAIGQAFAFFAIATSFLGVSLGLIDFLADGFKLPKKGMRRIQLAALTFLPPAFIALIDPSLFITALSFAGGVGCCVLLGIYPILMIYAARYTNKAPSSQIAAQLGGGKGLLFLLFCFACFELAIEALQRFG